MSRFRVAHEFIKETEMPGSSRMKVLLRHIQLTYKLRVKMIIITVTVSVNIGFRYYILYNFGSYGTFYFAYRGRPTMFNNPKNFRLELR
jgi:hypothetical protein